MFMNLIKELHRLVINSNAFNRGYYSIYFRRSLGDRLRNIIVFELSKLYFKWIFLITLYDIIWSLVNVWIIIWILNWDMGKLKPIKANILAL